MNQTTVRAAATQQQQVVVRVFAVALFVIAKGHELRDVRLADDGLAGECVFLFGPDARQAVHEYGMQKERLTGLMAEARRRR